MKRRGKIFTAVLLGSALVVFWRYPRRSPEPYQVFSSPDELHRLEVFTYSEWLPIVHFPGGSGDAPGRVFLRDAKGATLNSMPIEMVQMISTPEWTDRGVSVRAVLDWSW